jgi:hypothetical protein
MFIKNRGKTPPVMAGMKALVPKARKIRINEASNCHSELGSESLRP